MIKRHKLYLFFSLISVISILYYSCSKENYNDDNVIVNKYNSDKIFRGANITLAVETVLSESDVAVWKDWNINLIRINFNKDNITLASASL